MTEWTDWIEHDGRPLPDALAGLFVEVEGAWSTGHAQTAQGPAARYAAEWDWRNYDAEVLVPGDRNVYVRGKIARFRYRNYAPTVRRVEAWLGVAA